MTPSHVDSLRRVMDDFLRGEERVHRNGTPGCPLRSASVFYSCNNMKQRNRKRIEREKQARKTKRSQNSALRVILTQLDKV